MLGNLTGIHLLVILGIVILLFGATKLPALARGLGQSLNIFRSEIRSGETTKGSTTGTPGAESNSATSADD